jgi:hypothetical protein
MTTAYVIQLLRSGQLDATAQVMAPHLPAWTPIASEPTFAPYVQAPAPPVAAGPGPVVAAAPSGWGHSAFDQVVAPTAAAPEPSGGPVVVAPALLGSRPMMPDVSTGKAKRTWGYVLLGLAGFCLVTVPMMALDGKADPDTWLGGLLMTLIWGIPGALLLWSGRVAGARYQLIAFLTSRDRIDVAEVARRTRLPEREAEQLVDALNHEHGLGLLYVPEQRQFVLRGRVATAAQLPQHCPTCGAPTENAVVLTGERPKCHYCGAPLG